MLEKRKPFNKKDDDRSRAGRQLAIYDRGPLFALFSTFLRKRGKAKHDPFFVDFLAFFRGKNLRLIFAQKTRVLFVEM
jgi:hypothetical protein